MHRFLLDGSRQIDLRRVDLAEPGDLAAHLDGADIVFHQAAIPSVPRSVADPVTSHRANVNGTLALLMACRAAGVRRVVYASSSSVYGETPELPKREDMPACPISPYGGQKYFAGAAVIYGDGLQSRDFTYVANVVDANLRASEAANVAGMVFNVACGDRITVGDMLTAVQSSMSTSLEPIYAPPRSGDIRHSQAESPRARERLGWKPAASFENGLEQTIAWYRGRG